jgi:hypothetical protein
VSNAGLPRLSGGIAKAWREVWDRPCRIGSCRKPAAGVIETIGGPAPICATHIPGAEARGYVVHRRDEGA